MLGKSRSIKAPTAMKLAFTGLEPLAICKQAHHDVAFLYNHAP